MSVSPPLETVAIGPEQNGLKMTTQEFDDLTEVDELYTYELIRGVLVVNPPPLEQERSPNERLGHWLLKYQEEHPNGSSLDDTLSEQTVRTSDSRRRADRVIWAGLGRQPDPANDLPTIVVEFVSAGRRNWQRDYIEKRDEYLSLGIREYWIIDRFQRIMTVYCSGNETEQQILQENETYRPKLLPGFEIPLAKLLAAADRWNPAKPTD
jgi:Uma2 family endonuclease